MIAEKLIYDRWFTYDIDLNTVDVISDRWRVNVRGVYYEIYDKDNWLETFIRQPLDLPNKTLFPYQD